MLLRWGGRNGEVGRKGLSGHSVGLKVVCELADEGVELERCTEVMESVIGNVGLLDWLLIN